MGCGFASLGQCLEYELSLKFMFVGLLYQLDQRFLLRFPEGVVCQGFQQQICHFFLEDLEAHVGSVMRDQFLVLQLWDIVAKDEMTQNIDGDSFQEECAITFGRGSA